jgi:hypothetical protein
MGLTLVAVHMANPADPGRGFEEELLIDSGAVYSVVSGDKLGEIGIEPL